MRNDFNGMLQDIQSALINATNHIDERAEDASQDKHFGPTLRLLETQIDSALKTVQDMIRRSMEH